METWNNVPGAKVKDIPVSTPPNSVTQLTSLEISPHGKENYGVRIKGFLCAPFAADYTFYIAADDQAELWLSPDSVKANKKLVASVPHWVNSREFYRFPEQRSKETTLNSGLPVYLSVISGPATIRGDTLTLLAASGRVHNPMPPFTKLINRLNILFIDHTDAYKYF